MKPSRLIVALLPLALLLSACEKTDTDLVVDFVNSWLETRGAVSKNDDGSYSPTAKGIGVALGFGTTDDPQADAAVQSGKMLKDIAENDKLVDEADDAMHKKNPPDTKTAKAKLDQAIGNRPDDWYYRNRRAYFSLETGNDASVKKDLDAGANGCGGNSVCLAALHRDRANYYANSQLAAFASADTYTRTNCPLHIMAVESYQALIALDPSKKTSYEGALKTAQQQKQQYCDTNA